MAKTGNMEGVVDMLGEMGDILQFLQSDTSTHVQNDDTTPTTITTMVEDQHSNAQSEIM